MPNLVTQTPAATSAEALDHFSSLLAFETDCWDVHNALNSGADDFILVDVRAPSRFAEGHIKGAVNIPHGKMIKGVMARYPSNKMFVVYCEGPHCNGTEKAAINLAKLGLPVKKMIGGRVGWQGEGFELVQETYA
ncbi:MAG: rhodanese-like domain-containing protein [Sphingomonadales bacterium]|nr:rhodanese-like domain-containing protein [Sphingomonadales bacterium]